MGKRLLIAGFPKSGNTWLGYMLSYILGAKYIDLYDVDQKPTLHKETLQLLEGHLSHKSDYEAVCKTHDRFRFFSDPIGLASFDKVIHIVRDPRDIAVSYYFYLFYHEPIASGNPEGVLSRKHFFARKYYWKKTVYQVSRDWPLHTMSWRAYEGALLVRYEDLHIDCLAVLQRICSFLDWEYNPRLLLEAIDRFTFDRLSGGRKIGEEHPISFFRKGIIGDFRNHFDWVDTLIMRYYAIGEMQELGYEM